MWTRLTYPPRRMTVALLVKTRMQTGLHHLKVTGSTPVIYDVAQWKSVRQRLVRSSPSRGHLSGTLGCLLGLHRCRWFESSLVGSKFSFPPLR